MRLDDEALFVVPRSGALWSFDFGNKTEVLREADEHGFGPVFQVAQATTCDGRGGDGRGGEMRLFLVLPTFAAASLNEQDRIFSMLAEHDPTRPVALVVQHSRGRAVIVAGSTELVAPAAAATAVVLACWAWDESARFEISVDQLDYAVVARHDGERWKASIERQRSAT